MENHTKEGNMLSLKYIKKITKHYEKIFNTSTERAGAIMDYDVQDKPCAMVYVALPTDDAPFYKLGTIGMSEYRQKKSKTPYTELIMLLPQYWEISSNEPRWRWPITLLQMAVKAPYLTNSTFTYYHSFAQSPNFEPFHSSTDKSVVLFTPFRIFDKKFQTLRTGLFKKIHFMQMLPVNKFTYDAVDKKNRQELMEKLINSGQFSYLFY